MLRGTADNNGSATLSYIGQSAAADTLQASALFSGLPLTSNQFTATWQANEAPQITLVSDQNVTLPNSGIYTATVTDPTANSGPITVSWTTVSGPGVVTFEFPFFKTRRRTPIA